MNNRSPGTGSKPRLLLVDDLEVNLAVLEALLLEEDYDLDTALNGKDALRKVEENAPDLILLDIMMPGINGLEMCRYLKGNPNNQHIPILMVTALDTKQDLAEALNAGADDFISKPVEGIELRARVRSLLRVKTQHDALMKSLQVQQKMLKLREDMANMLVHDLRNPLNAIAVACDLLEDSELDRGQRTCVDLINKGYQNLYTMIDDLLIMGKIDSGNLVLDSESVNIEQLVKDSISEFTGVAKQRNIIVELQPASYQDPYLKVDRKLIRRLVDNLISNAIKFSPNGSPVYINLLQGSDHCKIEVSDHGIGVPQHLRQQIFEKYEVGNVVKNVKQVGLGLSFCKAVADSHGGHISVRENNPQGAIFSLELPSQ
ncbi:MAG: hybrid sensor histidine kinase/response regulator [Cyanobacteria bacterium P01_C01_bin.89]